MSTVFGDNLFALLLEAAPDLVGMRDLKGGRRCCTSLAVAANMGC
jgi:hypothetical protein